MQRDGFNRSLWQACPDYSSVVEHDPGSFDKVFDVVIVGGGITGISTALQLQSAGKRCLLLEAHTLGFGTTGGTTAHLNTFFDTPYHKVENDFGKENAMLLARGAADAMALIEKNIGVYQIECEHRVTEGYVFSVSEEQDKELDEMVAASQAVGVDVEFTNSSVFPVPYFKMAAFKKQAQFNPVAYIFSLAKIFEAGGGIILQHSRVMAVDKKNDHLLVQTQPAAFRTLQVVYATHIPPGVNLLHFRCAPYRSYAMAVKLKGAYPEALGYDMQDPYHYYRTQVVNDEPYLVVGGEDHKTGHNEHTENCFRNLESHIRTYFEVESVAYKWSSQYYEPADGLAYIGHLPGAGENIYVATGFGGNGMIYGTLSAIILSDLIINGESIYKELFDPQRVKPVAGFTNFVKENADVVASFITGRLNIDTIKVPADVAAGEARILRNDGHIVALYKDDAHQLHICNAVCTHVKCTVGWNESEKSWDCPCHGARYTTDGEVLTGPSQKDLEKINWEEPGG